VTPSPANTVAIKGPAVRDRFSAKPLIGVPIAWLLMIVPLIYDGGGLFLSPALLVALIVLLGAITVWLIAIVLMAISGCWRCSLSIAITLPVFVFASAATLRFKEQIRFQTMRPFYLIQIARLHADDGKPKHMTWSWSGGLGWDEGLIYDEADSDAPPPGQTVLVRRNEGCTGLIRPMGGHFYLSNLSCGSFEGAARNIEKGYEDARKMQQQAPR
jgi:hypothetical protein